jgi:hypothetical protein
MHITFSPFRKDAAAEPGGLSSLQRAALLILFRPCEGNIELDGL